MCDIFLFACAWSLRVCECVYTCLHALMRRHETCTSGHGTVVVNPPTNCVTAILLTDVLVFPVTN